MLCLAWACLEILAGFSDVPPDRMGYAAQMPNTPAIVMLADRDYSGAEFLKLGYGDPVVLDGRVYRVSEVTALQALDPQSMTGDFIELESGKRMTVEQVWRYVYDRPGALILQTCFERGGVENWGRVFYIANEVTWQQ